MKNPLSTATVPILTMKTFLKRIYKIKKLNKCSDIYDWTKKKNDFKKAKKEVNGFKLLYEIKI